jgi:geranylgeranyl pyrophosphate synthase
MTVALLRDEDYARAVDVTIHALASTLNPVLVASVETLASNPGKRLRSHLLEVCSRFGTPTRYRVVKLGALVELLHIASLLHDDVIDRTTMRRGRPTAHSLAGNEDAVLAGAACMALVGKEAAALGSSTSQLMSLAAVDLSYGELLDVERAYDTDLGVDEYLELVHHKTSVLFRLSCVLGAGAAGLDRAATEALAAFGVELGTAFQIADDCLDLSTDDIDKPIGTDHLLGLFGLPTLLAIRNGSDELRELLLSPTLTIDDLPRVRSLVVAARGSQLAMTVAQQHYDRARESLGALAQTGPGVLLLRAGEAIWPR